MSDSPPNAAAMFGLRLARPDDVPELASLIERSARGLSIGFYTPEQTDALIRYVFGVDSQLIADGTYFAVVDRSNERIVACGGWSRRRSLFGGDQNKSGPDPELDPAREPARVRAFFVDPDMARRGLGRRLMEECVKEARGAGFHTIELVSTLPGEALYLASGFTVVDRFELDLPGGVRAPVSRMHRDL